MSIAPAFYWRAASDGSAGSLVQVVWRSNQHGEGESIADLGGLTIAFAAYQKSLEGKSRPKDLDGFTPEQRFFLGFAQVWATNMRAEFARLLANTDPHPLPRFRLNGTLSNMPAFAKAFSCKQGEPMVRPDAER